MPKVVINRCFGGFGLSEDAYRELGLEWDGFGVAYNGEDKRTDQRLVEVVEKLGCEANGQFADLMIVIIPDDVDWEIEEYDGYEKVRERSRTWP